ncbi:MAG: hypothetical protein HGA85_04295 [Nanoarchaeota archaeon]|nr:hypothetical protein [Nanoarchaeota archaeon]
MTPNRKYDLIVFIILFSLVFSMKLDAASLPYSWDALGPDIPSVYINMARNGFNLLSGDVIFLHPPLPYLLGAASYLIFGEQPISIGILMLIASSVTLFFTYKIGELVYSKQAGALAALSLFLMPLFFSHSALSLAFNLVVPLHVMAVYFTLKHDLWKFTAAASAIALSREMDMITVLVLAIFWLRQKNKRHLALAIPFAVSFSWMVYVKLVYGSMIHPSFFRLFAPISIALLDNFVARSTEFFVNQGRFAVIGVILVSQYFQAKKPAIESQFEYISLVLILSALAIFSFIGSFLPRYLLPFYPLIFLLAFGGVSKYKSSFYPGALFIFLSIIFISGWHGTRDLPAGWLLETNMEYADMVKTHQEAAAYIQDNFPNALVATCWPMTTELSDNMFGYVDQKVQVTDNLQDPNVDIIYYSRQSNCYDHKISPSQFRLLKEFSSKGKLTRVYQRI